ncbi:unnamed protein product [Tilletia controversa]|nr:unnamed protein product [Tilletia controversa]CAD6947012.1 unnamed protein product [Tilletia laevis]CAD6984001.1 unnamed protein product [Tilletia controversa]
MAQEGCLGPAHTRLRDTALLLDLLASGFRAALLPDSASSQSCSPRAHTIALLSTRSGACGARICGLCFAIPPSCQHLIRSPQTTCVSNLDRFSGLCETQFNRTFSIFVCELNTL